MANVHVLTRRDAEITVAMHVAIPNTTNFVGVNYRTALLNSGKGGRTVLPDGSGAAGTISAAEKTSLGTGALYELVTTVRLDTVPLDQAPAFLDAEFTRVSAETLVRLEEELRFFGYTRP